MIFHVFLCNIQVYITFLYMLIANDFVFHDENVVIKFPMHNQLPITIVMSFNKK